MIDPESDLEPRRPESRRFLALVVITAAVALTLGVMLRQPAMMGANDISRWCTVWSLLERGTYVIDECPWLTETQDKVSDAVKGQSAGAEPVKHYFSSKPALLPTLIAALLYPARKLSGIPLDRVVLQEREERWVQKPDPDHPGKQIGVLEKPKDAVKWSAHVFYFKAVLLLLNIVPFWVFLLLYARILDRYAGNDWAWCFSLVAGALGTYLLPFTQTLNNHTIAAFSAFFALYHFLRIWDEGLVSAWRFASVGFWAAFTEVNELPALSFLALVAGLLLFRFPRRTLLYFLPAALIPVVASVAAQYAALGEFRLVYTEFGTESYRWEGSLWKSPLELDALNVPWLDPQEAARRGITREPYGLYLFHMTLGHHGFWSLSPIFFCSLWGVYRLLRGGGRWLAVLAWLTLLAGIGLVCFYEYDPAAWSSGGRLRAYVWVFLSIPALAVLLAFLSWLLLLRKGGEPMAAAAWMTALLTTVVLAFYTWNPLARNYGGSTQGLRWVFWLIPFWLLALPKGVEQGQTRPVVRFLSLAALALSVLSAGYALRNPWTHPWILDALEHVGLYQLPR